MKSNNNTDFWEELENNLKYILKEDKSGKTKSYALNKYAGVLSVWGNAKQQKAVANYLHHLQRLVTTQILIEAKIIEIELTDEYKGGIEWDTFFVKNASRTTPTSAPSFVKNAAEKVSPGIASALSPLAKEDMFSFYVQTQHLAALATFMQKFGTVRTLANPRLTVLNNQSAVLKVARNEVFFELQIEDVSMTMQSMVQKAESRIQTVPIGLILYVHPSVNFETGEIILAMHPMISRVVDVKSDPAVALSLKENHNNIRSEIPVVQVREMDSVVAARENQVIVTGGLMEETVGNKEVGTPGLSDIPILGNLFKYQTESRRTTELVILLRLRIVHGCNSVSPADTKLYHEFVRDPRPLPSP
jgi:MSHA type pilus biogenesis protein MshL